MISCIDHGKNPPQQGNGKNYQFICHHETASCTISNQMNWNEFGKIDLNCLLHKTRLKTSGSCM